MKNEPKNSKRKTLEGRSLQVLLIITIVSCVILTIYRVFYYIGDIVVYVYLIDTFSASSLYLLYLKKGNFEVISLVYFKLFLLTIAVNFFYDGGMTGVIMPYSFLYFICGLLILPSRYFFAFACITIIFTLSLGIIEFQFPDLISYQDSYKNQLLGNIFIFNFILLFLGFFLYFFKKDYEGEEERKSFLNNRLTKEKEKIETSERNKSKILNSIWQEMNTPIQNAEDILKEISIENLASKEKKLLSRLSKNNDFLRSILTDLMETYTSGNGRVPLENISFDLHDEIKELIVMLEDRSEQEETNYSIEFGKEIPSPLVGDSNKIKQTLGSLINNIIRFDKGKKFKLTIKLFYLIDQSCTIRFNLNCLGAELSKMEQVNIYDKLYNDSYLLNSVNSPNELNLIIPKNLIETMGSTIHFLDEKENGFNFYFDLVLGVADKEAK